MNTNSVLTYKFYKDSVLDNSLLTVPFQISISIAYLIEW
jgi:hypothetical protein